MTTYVVEEVHVYEIEAEDENEALEQVAGDTAGLNLVSIQTGDVYEKPTPPRAQFH